jgi:hypothetical protein
VLLQIKKILSINEGCVEPPTCDWKNDCCCKNCTLNKLPHKKEKKKINLGT